MTIAISSAHLVIAPIDGRLGIEGLSQWLQRRLGKSPCDGTAYVFVNGARTRLKLLCWDGNGVWLATRRLHRGRFVWPAPGATQWVLTDEQWQWLIAGVNWQRLAAKAPEHWRV